MRETHKKQSAITYEQYVETYEFTLNDLTREWSVRSALLNSIETNNPKMHARYMLCSGFAALKPGSLICIVQRKRSRTGFSRTISLYTFVQTKQGIEKANLTYHVGKLLGYNVHQYEGFQVIRTDDYPEEFIAHLSQALGFYLSTEVL